MGNKGWECPRCGKIWAPWVECCECTRQTITTTTTSQWNVTPKNNNNISWGTSTDNVYISATDLNHSYSVSNSLTSANTPYTLTSNKYIKEKK